MSGPRTVNDTSNQLIILVVVLGVMVNSLVGLPTDKCGGLDVDVGTDCKIAR